jgi:PPP family 3-phenylpropionic acid transporter
MAGGGYISYISLYYASVKISNTQIGMISSVGLLVGMMAQPMWGTIADRSTNKTFILNTLILLSAGLIWLIPLADQSFYVILIAVSINQFFGNAVQPMSDSITLELAQREGFKFSTVRFIGSAGFAVMSAIAGKIFAINITYIFLLFCVMRLLSFAMALQIPPVKGVPKAHNEKDSIFEIFKDRKLVVMYIYLFCITAANALFHSFHVIYSEQKGISLELIGLGIMIGSFSQFPFMFYFDWIYKKLGIVTILTIAGLMNALRWFLYYYALNASTILFIWVLHGFTYIVLYLCLADYVSSNVPKRFRTRGQMMNAIVIIGLSGIVGSTLSGIVSTAIGLQNAFLAASAVCLTAVAGFVIVTRLLPEFKTAGVVMQPADS